jgi:ATP phosphoribosyltransferase regulatory subunit
MSDPGRPIAAATPSRRTLVDASLQVLQRWGYAEVDVPLLAPFEELRAAVGADVAEELFRVVDREGRLLLLRGDMTPLVAWRLASLLRGRSEVRRVCYAARLARVRRSLQGQQNESYEVGMELVGAPGLDADLEVLGVAAQLVAAVGRPGAELVLGHVGIGEGWIEAASGGDTALAARLARHLDRRDGAALADEVAATTGPGAAAADVPAAIGDLCDVAPLPASLDRLTLSGLPRVAAAARELRAILEALQRAGLGMTTQLDLSARDTRGYYTGLRFRLVDPDLRLTIGGGGRYDHLYRHFGSGRAAVGMALRLDLLAPAGNALAGSSAPALGRTTADEDPAMLLRAALDRGGRDA